MLVADGRDSTSGDVRDCVFTGLDTVAPDGRCEAARRAGPLAMRLGPGDMPHPVVAPGRRLAARACKADPNGKNDPRLDFRGLGLHSFRRANITSR